MTIDLKKRNSKFLRMSPIFYTKNSILCDSLLRMASLNIVRIHKLCQSFQNQLFIEIPASWCAVNHLNLNKRRSSALDRHSECLSDSFSANGSDMLRIPFLGAAVTNGFHVVKGAAHDLDGFLTQPELQPDVKRVHFICGSVICKEDLNFLLVDFFNDASAPFIGIFSPENI